MSHLYEITENFKELEKLADDEGMAEAVADTMEAIEGEFNEKALALTSVTLNIDADIKAARDALKSLQARIKAMENKRDGLREYLRQNMEATGIKKISCPIFSVTCKKPAEVLVIEDEDLIPDDYMVVPEPVVKPDRKRLLADLKAGKDIPGVHKEPGKASLLIKV